MIMSYEKRIVEKLSAKRNLKFFKVSYAYQLYANEMQ